MKCKIFSSLPAKLIYAWLILFVPIELMAKQAIDVTLLIPSNQQDIFWSPTARTMQAAAKQFDINLTVAYTPYISGAININTKRHIELAKTLLKKQAPNSYFITSLKTASTSAILGEAEKRKINFISIVNPLSNNHQHNIGLPREKYKYWLGQFAANDINAGAKLSQDLLKKLSHQLPDKPTLLAISGSKVNTAAQLRVEGLEEQLNKQPGFNLQYIGYSDWSQSKAKSLTRNLMRRFPDTGAIWCANDHVIAQTVINQLGILGYTANKDILVGGIDWSKQGVELYKQGLLSSNYGGHYFLGATVLALIYDHHKGIDFYQQFKGEHLQDLIPIEPYVDKIDHLLQTNNWHELDYTIYSRVLNPEQTQWDLDFTRLLNPQ